MFFNFFKKKKIVGIPTIKASKEQKQDDRDKHKAFLSELNFLLKDAKIFKSEYIKKHVDLYNKYVPFRGIDHSLIYKSPYFEESLLDKNLKDKAKKIVERIVTIANSRSYNQIDLVSKKRLSIKKVTIIFPKSSICCDEVLSYKKRLDKKKISINDAKIFPLRSCVYCDCDICAHIMFLYKSDIYSSV